MRIRLSSNESPLGPSPRAVEAMREAVEVAHLYPDDQSTGLRQALAEHEDVPVERVVAGQGSAGILMDLIAHECRDGGAVLAYERSFVVYRLGARNAGVPYVEAPTAGPAHGVRDGYRRDPQALLDRIDDDTRMIVIDNPGNPTGTHLTAEELRVLAAGVPEHVTLVVDEAYHHFATGRRGYGTAAEVGLEHPRLVVTRTFSKAYGLAGVRVGYLMGPEELAAGVDAWRTRFNVTATAQAGAVAALADTGHLERTVDTTVAGRSRMVAWLRDYGIPVTDSLGNFVTLELGEPAAPFVEAYAQHGIGVRPLAPYGMTEQLRVTVGTTEELDEFLGTSEVVLGPAAVRRP